MSDRRESMEYSHHTAGATSAAYSSQSITLSYREAAKLIGVSDRTIWAAVARGDLPAARIGRRVLIRRCDLDNWLQSKVGNGGAA